MCSVGFLGLPGKVKNKRRGMNLSLHVSPNHQHEGSKDGGPAPLLGQASGSRRPLPRAGGECLSESTTPHHNRPRRARELIAARPEKWTDPLLGRGCRSCLHGWEAFWAPG